METLWDTEMTITLTLGTWMVPLAITILTLISFIVYYWFEDNDYWGFFGALMIGLMGIISTIISWVVWLIMTIMAK
jgi:hypothetical protein